MTITLLHVLWQKEIRYHLTLLLTLVMNMIVVMRMMRNMLLKSLKKYGKDAASKILKLMYKIEKREACIESQGELLLVEREKN